VIAVAIAVDGTVKRSFLSSRIAIAAGTAIGGLLGPPVTGCVSDANST
jgi:hypothetical protein